MSQRVLDVRRSTGRPSVARVAVPGSHDGLDPRARHLLDLQRTAGNSAVAQLVAEDAEVATAEGSSGPTAEQTAEAKSVFDKGAAAYAAGDFAHAADFFERAYVLLPRPGIVFSRAQALRRLGGRREEAIRCYEEYLATGHGVRDAEAKAFLEQLRTPNLTGDLEADTAVAKSFFDKGAGLYAQGDFAHAYDEFSRAWEMTGRPALQFSRAQCLRRLGGRSAEAIKLYQAYIDSGETNRAAEAAAFIKELQAPAPTGDLEADLTTGKSIFDKGAALYARGDYAHAYDEFTRSWELTGRPALQFTRAQCLRRLGGRTAEAISLYQEYLASGETSRKADAEALVKQLQEQGAVRS